MYVLVQTYVSIYHLSCLHKTTGGDREEAGKIPWILAPKKTRKGC